MATTTNFGWETPDDTDLVKDGAAAMRTLGNSIDTSFVDLKGGTTGQVLSKASNTDLDFTWVAQDDSNAIQNAIVDAKGDLISATAADTPARLAVGTNGQVLTADSTTATGLKWATASSAASNFTLLGTGNTTSGLTVTVSGISGINKIFVIIRGITFNAGQSPLRLRLNSDTGSNYLYTGWANQYQSTYSASNYFAENTTGTFFYVGDTSSNTASSISGGILIEGCNSTGRKMIFATSGANTSGGNGQVSRGHFGWWNNSATVSEINITTNNGFTGGSFEVWGSTV